MRFDDRLLTVLSQPAGDRHDAAVRWRQLVDLVARAGRDSANPVVERALEAIRADAHNVDEGLRAAAARAVAGRPLPLGLLEYLVSDRLSVSAPVLAAETLDPAQWRALLPLADEETRQFISALHPEAVRPSAAPDETPAEAADNPAPEQERPRAPSLSDVVARIERRRRSREARRPAVDEPIPHDPPALFRWECGPSGEIAWVEGAPRGALIGRSIARVKDGDSDQVDEEVVRAFARRAPFRDGEMTVGGEGLIAGAWKISGLPAFNPMDGRFAGYRGVAHREAATPQRERHSAAPDVLADPDSLRELVHEIKTPLNAIIGFAEIIEGQYLGPADHCYRERAGEIVGQARLLLGAIDDLDFAARIHSSAKSPGVVELKSALDRTGEALGEMASARGVEIELSDPRTDCTAAVEPEIADRLILRFGGALIGAAEAGEHLRIAIEDANPACRLVITRPGSMRNLPDDLLFEGVGGATEPASLAGFSLRLVRGLARIAGGDLIASPTTVALVLPCA